MVEGTVLYHVNRAASILSPKSVKNFIKALKECNYHPQFVLQPFFLTLLLNLSRVSSAFEEEILNLLTSVIMKAIAQDVKIFNSAWFKLIVLGNVNVEDIIKNVMENW